MQPDNLPSVVTDEEYESAIRLADRAMVLRYIEMTMETKEVGGRKRRLTKTDIANELGVSTETLRRWVSDWKQTGLYSDVLEEVNSAIADDLLSSLGSALLRFGDILEVQIQDALLAHKPSDRARAAAFVRDTLENRIAAIMAGARPDDERPSDNPVHDPLQFVKSIKLMEVVEGDFEVDQ